MKNKKTYCPLFKQHFLLFAGILIAAVCYLSFYTVPVSAANTVDTIQVEVLLQEDGSADITQTWSGDFDEGTECYIPFRTNGYLDILNLTVSNQSLDYETLSEWDVDASFEEKVGKCGLNETDEGYEICWGLTEYGTNTYTIRYTVPSVVGSYTESDGFLFRFINEGMNTGPTDANITIKLADGTALSNSNANIWAFGYDGEIQFVENAITAYTHSALDESNHMTLMVELEKGLLSPSRSVEDSFETIKDRAFEDSDYASDQESDDTVGIILIAVCVSIIFLVIIICIVVAVINRIKFKRFVADTNYYRDVPNDGHLNATYMMGHGFRLCKEESIIGARLLKLITIGALEPVTEENLGLFGRVRTSSCLHLLGKPGDNSDFYDKQLYDLLEKAAGDDGILEKKELEKYCAKYPSRLRNFITTCNSDGQNYMIQQQCYSKTTQNKLRSLSEKGKEQLRQIIGYKKYLSDFSLIAEREVTETFIWQDCMVYALLLGIADKVSEQLKHIYPQYVPEIEVYQRNVTYAYNFHAIMYSSMVRREQEIAAERSAGSGGSSSFGGGGGFSGGGFGGGTR